MRQSTKTLCFLFPTTEELTAWLRVVPDNIRQKSLVVSEKPNKSTHIRQWTDVASGKAQYVFGVKSAVFLPYPTGTTFIIDSEESAYHKNFDQNPRYHIAHILRYFTEHMDAHVIRMSRQPSLRTYVETKQHRVRMFDARKKTKTQPRIIDMHTEQRTHQYTLIGYTLEQTIDQALKKNERVILFFNRKGFIQMMECADCHAQRPFSQKMTACPSCASHHMRKRGIGIEHVAEQLAALFPATPLSRLSADEPVASHTDIVLMTSYGIEKVSWKNVSVFAILGFEQLLSSNSFTSHEHAWYLLQQFQTLVDTHHLNTFIIQTYRAEHHLLRSFIADDDVFYREELLSRKQFLYPPYAVFTKFLLPKNPAVKTTTRKILEKYGDVMETNDGILILKTPHGIPRHILNDIPNTVLVDREPANLTH